MRTLVLLPGMLCGRGLWAAQEKSLAEYAEVRQPALTAPTIDAMVDQVLDAAPPRFSLAGLSLGGIVAMALLRRAPERVERLAVLSTNARPPRQQQLASWQSALSRLANGASARSEQQLLLPALVSRQDPELTAEVLSMADEVGEDAYRAQLMAQATRVDERPALGRTRCPVLVVAAGKDAVCPLDYHEEIARLVPGARLAVVEDAGHLSPLEQPEAITALLSEWLTDHDTRSA